MHITLVHFECKPSQRAEHLMLMHTALHCGAELGAAFEVKNAVGQWSSLYGSYKSCNSQRPNGLRLALLNGALMDRLLLGPVGAIQIPVPQRVGL